MLDQNTDRMWYVIGAVIIGAAIILILNGTMPQLFASVADTFKGKTEEVTEITDGIAVNAGLDQYDVDLFPLVDITTNEWILGEGQFVVDYRDHYKGDAIRPENSTVLTSYIPVEAGDTIETTQPPRGLDPWVSVALYYYDSNHNYIGRSVGYNATGSFKVVEGAEYIRYGAKSYSEGVQNVYSVDDYSIIRRK